MWKMFTSEEAPAILNIQVPLYARIQLDTTVCSQPARRCTLSFLLEEGAKGYAFHRSPRCNNFRFVKDLTCTDHTSIMFSLEAS